MQVRLPALWSRRLREILTRNPALTSLVAICWVVHRALPYPAEYLFSLDREIWFIQIGTWFLFAAEGIALGVVVSNAGSVLPAVFGARKRPPFSRAAEKSLRFLASPAAPVVAGLLSAALIAWVWGSLRPVPVVHDEAAYLLQAKLYAAGRWKGPPAPIPEFFEQMYVFVWPFTAAKYPPGFPAALVPGVALGIPAAVPIAIVGISGALLFFLARSITNPWIGAVAWVLWTTDPHDLSAPPAFMSQHLTTLLWLASWWALQRWRRQARLRDLLLLAFFVGWGAITRPLTMFAAAIPIGVAVLALAARRKCWGQVAASAALGLALLLVIPLWSQKTTGNWRITPLALHVRWYTPYDALGFGLRPPPPVRKLPPDLQEVTTLIAHFNAYHTVRNIPRLILERTTHIAADVFPRWRMIFVPLLLYGVLCVPLAGRFAAGTALADFIAYLFFPHSPISMYYEETYTVIAFLAAAGLWSVIAGERETDAEPGRESRAEARFRVSGAAAFCALVLVAAAGSEGVYRYRLAERLGGAIKERFQRRIDSIPEGRAVVFLRYAPAHLSYRSLVENDADLSTQRVWLVYDRGADNARLRKLSPDRMPYLYDEGREKLIRLDAPMGAEDRRWVGASAAAPVPNGIPTARSES